MPPNRPGTKKGSARRAGAAHSPPVVEDQSAVRAFMEDPATHGGRPVERIDTHGAMIFLVGRFAYKIKRSVAYPYMDFSTLDKRRMVCERELAINRRTAPEIYLALMAVVETANGVLCLIPADEARGRVVEWAVRMRRFPQEAIFSNMADRGALTPALARSLADAVADFHEAAERLDGIDMAGRLKEAIDETMAALRADRDIFDSAAVAAVRDASLNALDRLADLIGRRAETGFVRHCHGDLHLHNICLIDGRPTLFDAIEFNETFAVIDTYYDLAFLLMDLIRRDLDGLANVVLNRYLERTGDDQGIALLPMMISLRAAIRAKVVVDMAALQEGTEQREDLLGEARADFELAREALRPVDVRLVAIGGLSGTGKSTLARAIAPMLAPPPGAIVLRSDVLRKEFYHVGETDRLPSSAYGTDVTARVYAEIATRARDLLSVGRSVIVDAVAALPAERDTFESLAANLRVRFDGLWLEADPAVLRGRVTGRADDASDADASVVERQLDYDTGPITWRRIDAADTPRATLDRAIAALELRSGRPRV